MLRRARHDSGTLFVGIDPVHANLVDASSAALRKRTSAPNALFVLASVEALPRELEARAGHVTVTLPWGSLLRAVALPDVALLANIRRLCRPGATFETVFSASPGDQAQLVRLDIADPDPCPRIYDVEAAYAAAGLELACIEELPPGALAALDTTWARRLARDARRRAWRLSATAR